MASNVMCISTNQKLFLLLAISFMSFASQQVLLFCCQFCCAIVIKFIGLIFFCFFFCCFCSNISQEDIPRKKDDETVRSIKRLELLLFCSLRIFTFSGRRVSCLSSRFSAQFNYVFVEGLYSFCKFRLLSSACRIFLAYESLKYVCNVCEVCFKRFNLKIFFFLTEYSNYSERIIVSVFFLCLCCEWPNFVSVLLSLNFYVRIPVFLHRQRWYSWNIFSMFNVF